MSEAPNLFTTPLARCHILALPAELRNHIYRLVLLQDDQIVVSDSGYPREGLVNVSKLIRAETLKIFYYENKFGISTPRYDPTNAVKWYSLCKELGLEIDMRMIEQRKNMPDVEVVTWWDLRRFGSDRIPHWGNLLKWMEFVHAGKAVGNLTSPLEYYQRSKTSRRSLLMKGLFATVEDLKELPWSAVEKIVYNQRPTLGESGGRMRQGTNDVAWGAVFGLLAAVSRIFKCLHGSIYPKCQADTFCFLGALDSRWMMDEEISESLKKL